MSRHLLLSVLALAAPAIESAHAAAILEPTDAVFSFSLNAQSFSAPTEGASSAIDGVITTKYANLTGANSGLVIAGYGSSFTASQLVLTTANSFPERDPSSFILLGSNNPTIDLSQNSPVSNGWTYVAGGSLSLPTNRFSQQSINLSSGFAAYSSYWLIFPTLRSSAMNVMQIAEVGLANASGQVVPASFATATATGWSGSSLNAGNALDGNPATGYSGGLNSGIEVMPSHGPSVVRSFSLTSGVDTSANDPSGYSIYGQNLSGAWQLIQSGTLAGSQMPSDRGIAGDAVTVTNDTAYSAYGFLVTSSRSPGGTVEFGDIQLFDTVPEASIPALAAVASMIAAGRRRR